MISVTEFGAVPDGKTLCTENIQAAINTCFKNGEKVFFPKGRYLSGTLHLHSNTHIYLEEGAVLLGSKNTRDDFLPDEFRPKPLFQDPSHSFYNHSLFVGKNCENITFSGLGAIDMQSAWEMDDRDFGKDNPDRRRGVKTLTLVECRNVTVKDLNFLGATDLTLYFLGCEDVTVTNVNIVGHIDGISPDCCKNVTISNCNVTTGDDGIVLKSSYSMCQHKICEDVIIKNCTVSSRCSAIKLGTESNAGYRNIKISGCEINNTRLSGLALEIADGGILENIDIENIKMRNVGTPVFIVHTIRKRGPGITENGVIRNIHINNVTATGPYEPWEAQVHDYFHPETLQHPEVLASSISGIKAQKAENIALSNIYIEVPGGETDSMKGFAVPENEDGYPENSMFGKLPAYGLFCRHCKGLTLKNVEFKTLSPDNREAIIFEDC